MIDKIDRPTVAMQALEIAFRVFREGGLAQVQIQAPDTDEVRTVELDRSRACDLICVYCDGLCSTLWQQIHAGQSLSSRDWEFLKVWSDATLAGPGDAERTDRATFNERRARFYLIKGDRS